MAVSLMSGCGEGGEEAKEDGSGGRDMPATLGKQLAEANKISGMEGDIKQQQAQFIALAKEYEKKTGQKLDGVQLNADQQKMLQEMIQNEKDVSYSGLIQDILDRQKKIDELNGQIQEIKGRLPQPITVQKGETHYQIALKWLTEDKGVAKDEATKLIKRAMLSDHLAAGHEVWNFYEDGVFATAVTQGSARISPYLLNLSYEKKIIGQRDDALTKVDQMTAEMAVLEQTKNQLQADVSRLEDERSVLITERDTLTVRKDELETHIASAHYYVDTKRALKDAEILMGKKLVNIKPELFNRTVDLRADDTIVIRASDYDLKKIGDATIFPNQLFLKKKDYTVTLSEDRQKVVLKLSNEEKFTNASFVILVR